MVKGAEVDIVKEEFGVTPLHCAAGFGLKQEALENIIDTGQIARLLIDHGANTNAKNAWDVLRNQNVRKKPNIKCFPAGSMNFLLKKTGTIL